jgi:hypothetical protein
MKQTIMEKAVFNVSFLRRLRSASVVALVAAVLLGQAPSYGQSKQQSDAPLIVPGETPEQVFVRIKARLIAPNPPVLVVDGKKIASAEKFVFKPEDIGTLTELTAKTATELYGKEGKHGAILLNLKKKS